jgi:hypothetical protein
MRRVAQFERPPEPPLDQAVRVTHTPANRQSAVAATQPPRFELPLLGSNQDSPDPEGPL